VERGLLVAHDEVSVAPTGRGDPHRIIRPRRVPFAAFRMAFSHCVRRAVDRNCRSLPRQPSSVYRIGAHPGLLIARVRAPIQ
jgi:hypothetical protein